MRSSDHHRAYPRLSGISNFAIPVSMQVSWLPAQLFRPGFELALVCQTGWNLRRTLSGKRDESNICVLPQPAALSQARYLEIVIFCWLFDAASDGPCSSLVLFPLAKHPASQVASCLHIYRP